MLDSPFSESVDQDLVPSADVHTKPACDIHSSLNPSPHGVEGPEDGSPEDGSILASIWL